MVIDLLGYYEIIQHDFLYINDHDVGGLGCAITHMNICCIQVFLFLQVLMLNLCPCTPSDHRGWL